MLEGQLNNKQGKDSLSQQKDSFDQGHPTLCPRGTMWSAIVVREGF